jgi:hypothetical protein
MAPTVSKKLKLDLTQEVDQNCLREWIDEESDGILSDESILSDFEDGEDSTDPTFKLPENVPLSDSDSSEDECNSEPEEETLPTNDQRLERPTGKDGTSWSYEPGPEFRKEYHNG